MKNCPRLHLSFSAATILYMAVAIIMVLGLCKPALSCDVAVISAQASSSGRPILWKNFDCSAYWKQEVKYYTAKTATAGDYMLLYHFDDYMEEINDSPVMPQSGSNAAGFACSAAAVYEDLAPLHEAGNLNTDLIQHAVEECATISDWENLLKTWPSSHIGHAISANFVVVDAQGGAALYECYTGRLSSGLLKIQYRKYNANTGEVVDNNGNIIQAAQSNFSGWVTRTNLNNYVWYNSGYERYLRAKEILTTLSAVDPATGKTSLNAENIMRYLAKDVNGKQYGTGDETKYSTTYCISRSQTRSATVFEGVPAGGDPRQSVYWTALGEPSCSVFVPNMIGAQSVSDYVYMDEIQHDGDMKDDDDSSLLVIAEDERETYNSLIRTSNRGDVTTGPYSKNINKVELAKLQQWTFPIEETVVAKTHELLDQSSTNPDLLTPEYLKAFTDYCGRYIYKNYTAASSIAELWGFIPPGEEDTTPPTAQIRYSTTATTNQDVVAEVVYASEPIIVINNDGSTKYTFTENGSFTFEFKDAAGNIGTAAATVTWIDKSVTDPNDTTPPTAEIRYSTQLTTNQPVTAELVNASEPITVTNNNGSSQYTFTDNGSFTFEFVDANRNTGSATATVSWIDKSTPDPNDKIPPTAEISYSTTSLTNQDVTVELVDSSEPITIINNNGSSQYTFTLNGSFTFQFTDAAGNTGTATATVNWIDKTPPIGSVLYDHFVPFDGPVTATLVTNEQVTMIDSPETTHVFAENGSYAFKFKDAAGNTSSATATVFWLTPDLSLPSFLDNEFGSILGNIGSWFNF